MTETITIEKPREDSDIIDIMQDSEKERLAACENVIRKGLATFLEVGWALAEIHDNRLYRQTHKTFPKYAREVWDLGKTSAYQQMDAYRTVNLLQEKMSANADVLDSVSEKLDEATCADCSHRKGMANRKYKGVRIPWGSGKCTRPEGLCKSPDEDAPAIREDLLLPRNEAQARPLTTLPLEDRPKVWDAIVEKLEEDPGTKITKAFVEKFVKQFKGEKVKNKTKKASTAAANSVLVSPGFKRLYNEMLEVISDARNGGWTDNSKPEVIKHIKIMLNIAESDD